MEIERRFLPNPEIPIEDIIFSLPYINITQGYIAIDEEKNTCTRIRITNENSYLTIKKKISLCSALEFEYTIPFSDATTLLETMSIGYTIHKKRYYYETNEGLTLEIDIFGAENAGLCIVEVEMPTEEHLFVPPIWLGNEITGKSIYSNTSLALAPFTLWNNTPY